MNTITVENVNYEFQDIPGKGKCLVPVKKRITLGVGTKLKCVNISGEVYTVVKEPKNRGYFIVNSNYDFVSIYNGIQWFATLKELEDGVNADQDWSLK
jgi:hypothetical protein